MNFPFFVARRIRQPYQATFSATVARVGTVSIALGVAVGIVAVSVLLGYKHTIYQKIFLFGSHIQVNKISLNQSLEESALPLHTPAYDDWKNVPNVRHRQAVAHKPCILKTPNELQGALLKGVGRDYDWAFLKQYMVAGRTIAFSDSGYSNDIILSKRIANSLKLAVGQSVILYFVQDPPRARKLRVVGLYETHVEEFDSRLILGDLALLQRLNNWGADSVGAYEYFVTDFDQLPATAQQIDAQLDTGARVQTITQNPLFRPLFDWLSLLDTNTVVLLVLVLFVACFNIVSVLLVMVMERTPMVGLFKTLGSPNAQIRRIFWYVGLQLAVRGLLIGNAVGLGLCWLQQQFKLIPLDPISYYMDTVPIWFDWRLIVLLNVGVFVLVGLILFIPTVIVGRIQPVQALVFKK
ncbi:MAG: ABC transporter permease [Runella slithyformis]|nr:MAG: ABC transporter permease [Runella slithyformis]TAF02353.1 MAG: ABC transporter permease [Runella slithyformis]TAF28244.1 MAG: ABC transporter permease [Runella slithyformis]TAF46934.1 MAG: ABC transporter permease [Runella slithyformis]TAF83106.1 MAG: ABC transporter permease [Runella slithyformis]